MALCTLRDVSVSYGVAPLLDRVTYAVGEGERIGLLGRNGAGKTTLLRLCAGRASPDSGTVERLPGLRVALLEQEVPAATEGTVFDVVRGGLLHAEGSDGKRLVETVLSRLSLDGEASFGPLSAGNKRRVMLARALAGEPDLLLLDEPTNHLDVAAIEWLEGFLAKLAATIVFVTHDRAFLRAVATRIVELDRGALYDFPGDYRTYLERRQALLDEQATHEAKLDKLLAKEEAWLRQGIKARRTRDEGRKRALMRLRDQRRARRERVGAVRMNLQEASRSGKLVIEAEGLSVGYGERTVVDDLSTLVMRGDKVGVVGENGCGKTTLLRALLAELPPAAGRVRHGAKVEVAYFDQLREELDLGRSVRDNVCDGGDHVTIDGRPCHVMTYLSDWLFGSERANCPVEALSGGERNRLLLARLFLQPSNLLVLDEPTNDLDVETLELLEERLIDYAGAVIVVSHDREFLDNVATSTIAYEGDGKFVEYAGGYSDWQSQRRERASAEPPPDRPRALKPRTEAPRKPSYKERRELEELPARIEALEQEQADIHQAMADPAFYQQGAEGVAGAKARLEQIEGELGQAYERWQLLEEIAAAVTVCSG